MTKHGAIKYAKHLVPDALDAVERRLLDAEAPLFQMNGALVEMIRLNAMQAKAEEDATGVRREVGSLVIKQINSYRLLEIMLRHAKFAVWSERRGTFVAPSSPPLDFAKHFEARGMWNLRVLRGIVEAPTLRADGTVLATPGYDTASGLFLDTGGIEFAAVPDRPSRDDGERGLAILKDIIKDFPFVPDQADTAQPGRSASPPGPPSAVGRDRPASDSRRLRDRPDVGDSRGLRGRRRAARRWSGLGAARTRCPSATTTEPAPRYRPAASRCVERYGQPVGLTERDDPGGTPGTLTMGGGRHRGHADLHDQVGRAVLASLAAVACRSDAGRLSVGPVAARRCQAWRTGTPTIGLVRRGRCGRSDQPRP